MLKKFKMEGYNPVETPTEPGLQLLSNMSPQQDKEKEEMKQIPYKEAVGALLYLSTTMSPGISYAVGQVAKYSKKNREPALESSQTHFPLQNTRTFGILYSQKKRKTVMSYTDADHAGDLDDRASTSGCVLLCCSGSISWFSRKQECNSLSTTESKFVAGSEAAKEAGGYLDPIIYQRDPKKRTKADSILL
jgi:hypothetical protein